MIFNEQLIAKYNQPAPRYTSYPPANYFQDTLSSEGFMELVEASNSAEPRNISLYFHIPYCRKRCFYCGCNAYSMARPDETKSYTDSLIQEFRLTAEHLDKQRPISQVHFGGGTPNALPIDLLRHIMEAVSQYFSYTTDAEIAIECNPAYLDASYIEGLAQLGFNRFSLGIQDLNEKVLQAVNRTPSKLPLPELMQNIRNTIPAATINLDFIYGLPLQNPTGFSKTIDRALSLRPDRMVTFSYAHMPSIFKAQQLLEEKGLPSPSDKLSMFQNAFEQITAQGYRAIGFDHFALENDELSQAQKAHQLHRNFQGYCTRKTTGQVYAFGVSGISQLENGYIQNSKSIAEYQAALAKGEFKVEKAHRMTPTQKIVREAINELMCNFRIDFEQLDQRLHQPLGTVKNTLVLNLQVLDAFALDGILDYTPQSISMNPEGILFIRNVAAAIDPLMKNNIHAFSKTV